MARGIPLNEIIIKAPTPGAAQVLVLAQIAAGFNATSAKITYDIKNPTSEKLRNASNFPLVLEGTMFGEPMRICVTKLVIGQHCDGAYALRTILKKAGFYIEEKDLFTLRLFDSEGRIHKSITKR